MNKNNLMNGKYLAAIPVFEYLGRYFILAENLKEISIKDYFSFCRKMSNLSSVDKSFVEVSSDRLVSMINAANKSVTNITYQLCFIENIPSVLINQIMNCNSKVEENNTLKV